MRPPLPLLARWGVALELFGGLALQGAPFLAFASVPLLTLRVPVPGLLLHGGILLVCGTLAILLALLRRPRPGAQSLVALAAAGTLAWDAHQIMTRTDYVLGRVQLSLLGLNQFLANVGGEPIDLMPRGTEPAEYLGIGIQVGLAGALLLMLGACFQVLGLSLAGKRWYTVILSLPRCSSCGHGAGYDMAFCPGCGRRQGRGAPCRACGAWMQSEFRFCPACGVESPAGSG